MAYTKETYLKFVELYNEQVKDFEYRIKWYQEQIEMNKKTVVEYIKRARKL